MDNLGIQWLNVPQEIVSWVDAQHAVEAADTTQDRVAALQLLAESISAIEKMNLPNEIQLSESGLTLVRRNGSYSVGVLQRMRRGANPRAPENVARFAAKFDSAYATAEGLIQEELANIESAIESGMSILAAEEIEAYRARIECEKSALNKSRDSLRQQRMEHIESVGEELGYSIRKMRIGKKTKYVLARNH